MPPVVTDAIVLHAFDYLESSRILKLVTRDAGVRSVLARGARRSKRRFGAALDLFAQGTAELHVKPGRDLDTLAGFDVMRARPQLAATLPRFAGANAIAELTLRFGGDDTNADLFDTVAATLDAIAASMGDAARDATLAGAWRVLADLGVAPTIDACAECHRPIDVDAPALFSHPAGGVVCARCGHLARSARTLPPAARAALRGWLDGAALGGALGAAPPMTLDANDARAHQRLLREFVREHLADDRPLRAFENWEQETLMPRVAGGAA